MKKMKLAVLDDYDGTISKLGCWSKLIPDFDLHFFATSKTPEEVSSYDVIVTVRERTIVTREFLEHAHALKHLAVTGRLSGQADLAALKKRGIATSFTDGSGQSAAELTIALLLSATKGIHFRHDILTQGGWQQGAASSLAGKTLGVLGLGRIGQKVARFGKLMEMTVVSWGPTEDAGRSGQLGVERVSLQEVLTRADVLCICLRLSETTRALLGKGELSLLKGGSLLVNTARAEIVDREALYSELASKRIWGAFDVFHQEPLPANDPIRRFPNVLLSPHMGYVTNEVYQTFFSQVVENILNWEAGKEFKNALT